MPKINRPTLKHLMVMNRMIEENLGLVVGSHSMGTSTYSLFNRDAMNRVSKSHDWFNTNMIKSPSHVLYSNGWIARIKKPPADDPDNPSWNGPFAWYEHPYVITKEGRSYWEETGKALYEKLLAAEQAKRDAVDRLVIVSCRNSSDRKGGMLARVVRETAARLYVEIIDNCDGSNADYYYVLGSHGNYYISRDQVFKDDVSRDYYNRLVEVENDIVAEKKAARDQLRAELAEVNRRFKERSEQKSAYYDGLIDGVEP